MSHLCAKQTLMACGSESCSKKNNYRIKLKMYKNKSLLSFVSILLQKRCNRLF